MEITGGCLCGSVRYRFAAAPIVTRVCWCRDCQYPGAGSGTVNVCFVRVGTLDDPQIARPAATIWSVSAPTWACIDSHLPRVERQAPPAA